MDHTNLHVGFTGNRGGLTRDQWTILNNMLLPWMTLHHGDCVGADAQAHSLALSKGLTVVVHPPDNPKFRAGCIGHEMRPEAPYLVRNHHIVDESNYLIAFPEEYTEVLRSGTWATIRYAKKVGVPVSIVHPNGFVDLSRWGS